jgi:hypothetical protein
MISRSQMNRQLYQFGTDPRSTGGIDSLRPQFVTGPNSSEQINQMRTALQEAQKVLGDPIGILRDLFNNDIDTYQTVLRRLRQVDPKEARRVQYLIEVAEPVLPEQERQSQDVPEYYDSRLQILNPEQMREEMQNPSMPGMARGGIMTLAPRGQYGFGSFVKSIGKAVSGVVDTVKKVADPIAQVLAVVPNPYQPYAQMYTAARSSGLGGKDYGGLQIGGFTPGAYGGTYGINPMQSPFKIPGSGGAEQGGIFGGFGTPSSNQGLFSLANTFAPEGGVDSANEVYKQISTSDGNGDQSIWDKVLQGGKDILGGVLDNISEEVQKPGGSLKALETITKLGTSIYFGNLAREDQERINRLKQEAYDRYMAGVAAKRGEYFGKTPIQGIEVTGVPTQASDVVRAPAAYGGRIGFAYGSVDEGIMAAPQIASMMGMPVGNPRQNQQGVAELDYRDVGGFVPPIGIKEKADDIPAMLSNNEFVFTANAVKNADPSGNRDPEEGAKVMYRTMKMLENGGMV